MIILIFIQWNTFLMHMNYFLNRLAEDTITAERDYSKGSLHSERQLASKISSRLEIMHNKEMKKERNRGEKELLAATKKFRTEKTSYRKKQKKALHQIERERTRCLSHREELMMKLENSNLRVKG